MMGTGYVMFHLGAGFGKVLLDLLQLGIWLLHTAGPTAYLLLYQRLTGKVEEISIYECLAYF